MRTAQLVVPACVRAPRPPIYLIPGAAFVFPSFPYLELTLCFRAIETWVCI